MDMIIYAAVTLGGIGLLFGGLLALASRVFAVEVDERVEAIADALPGANCGVCGYAGCNNFAEKVVAGEAEPNACIPGGKDVIGEICNIMCIDDMESAALVAMVACAGDHQSARDEFIYYGARDCRLAHKLWEGHKGCRYGCLGLGTCAELCPFDAIIMADNGLPLIDEEACTGCGVCRNECPRDVIRIIPKNYEGALVYCNSKDRGKKVKEVCTVGCISCKACAKVCPQEAITMENNLPVFDLNKCDNCGECIIKCRQQGIYSRNPQAVPVKEASAAAAAGECSE